MEINILSTGSKGNCAIINDNGAKLMIDCGIKYTDIICNVHFESFKGYESVLVTHSHKDHSLAVKDLKLSGMNIFDTSNPPNKWYNTENFSIYPFLVKHNVDCQGFIIKAKQSNKTIFWATDCYSTPIIKGCDLYFLEVNYDNDSLTTAIQNGTDIRSKYEKHNSLENAVDFFKHLDKKPEMIVAIHGSQHGLLNKELTRKTLNQFCDKVLIAQAGLNIVI